MFVLCEPLHLGRPFDFHAKRQTMLDLKPEHGAVPEPIKTPEELPHLGWQREVRESGPWTWAVLSRKPVLVDDPGQWV
jgi:hypothetical protein